MRDDIHHEAWRDRVVPALVNVVRQGDVAEVRRWLDLIGRGASPDARNEDGEWPLFWAVYKGHTSVVRHLLVGGAKRNQLDAEGHDELWLAQTLGRQDIVAILEGSRARHTNRHVRKHPGGII